MSISSFPLAGRTVAVTASRRVRGQVTAFERQGARVLVAPTVRIVPVADDAELHAVTDRIIADPPQAVLVTTGYGLNGWFEDARERGLEDELRAALAGAVFLVRGAKGRGAVRALGFEDSGMAVQERTSSLVDLAVERGVGGLHVVVQQHGSPDAVQEARLVAAGARVSSVVPHRWEAPERPELVREFMAEIGRKGGSRKTEAQRAALAKGSRAGNAVKSAQAIGRRAQIQALKEAGYKQREVAQKMGLGIATIKRAWD